MWQHWEDGASRPARQAVVIALQLAPHDRHHDEAAAPLAACPSRQARSQGPIGGLLDSAAEIPPSIVLAAAVIALHQLKPFLAVGRMVDRRALDARSLRRRLSRAASGSDVVCAAAISPAAMLSPFAALTLPEARSPPTRSLTASPVCGSTNTTSPTRHAAVEHEPTDRVRELLRSEGESAAPVGMWADRSPLHVP